MKAEFDFEDIRPYHDDEVIEVLTRLNKENSFFRFAKMLYRDLKKDDFNALISRISTVKDFQITMVYAALKLVNKSSVDSITIKGINRLDPSQPYLFISNHRDIILDPATLNMLLHENGFDTTRVAIGNNLLNRDWIRDMARLNKSFIVYRNLPLKQLYLYSQKLSRYIRKSIHEDQHSVWIAQREGRAKDGNDVTQLSLLKMLSFVERKKPLEYLSKLHIVPVSISYEYDPCDMLKVREILMKKQNKDYKKTASEDIVSMLTGIKGYKGRINLCLGEKLTGEINQIILREVEKNHLISLAALIDEKIQRNYRLWPTNYIAYDMLVKKSSYQSRYSKEEKSKFLQYFNQKISDIKDPGEKAEAEKLFLMIYANPVKNALRYQ
ncbi:1-acyl-sn-glycerol-3-phosphate acyltransferase [Bacteroidota bacterium]